MRLAYVPEQFPTESSEDQGSVLIEALMHDLEVEKSSVESPEG